MAIQTSAAYRSAVAQNARTWRLKIDMYLDAGQELHLTEEDVTLGSFSFEEASTCSDLIDVGSTYANSLNFSLQNPDGRFNGLSFAYARLTASVGLLTGISAEGDYEWEDIPLGEFFVQEDGKRLSSIPLKCLDRMSKLGGLFSDLPLLAGDTPAGMMAKIAAEQLFYIQDGTQTLINTLTEPIVPSVLPEKMTCRDFIGYCAAVLGRNARFGRDGKLEFYRNIPATDETEAPILTTPDIRLSNMEYSDRRIQITGVSIKDAYEEEAVKGEDDYMVSMDANPLLTTPELTASALNAAFDALCLPYSGFQTGFIGDPSIQAGDPIRHTGLPGFAEGTGVNSVVTGHIFKFRGNCTLEATGTPAESGRQLTSSNKKILEARQKAKEDLNLAMDSMAKAVVAQTELLTNALGFYVDYEIDESSGAITRFWIMDKPTKEEASIIWNITEQGWQASTDGGETWTSGWDAGGNIIARSVTAEWVKTQALSALDGLLSVDLTNGQLGTRTETGITSIYGHEMNMSSYDGAGNVLSNLKISADTLPGDNAADMKISFGDKDGNPVSFLSQRVSYDPETGAAAAEPLTASDLLVQSRLEVADAVVYDNIIMQRKSAEAGNTGVDFVITKED